MAFSEKLREAVTKTHRIGTGLIKDFLLLPVKSFLHFESFKSRIPFVTISDDSKMRERFDRYMGYERHRVKFDEDFWQRRQKNEKSLAFLERQARGKLNPTEHDIMLSVLTENGRQMREGV